MLPLNELHGLARLLARTADRLAARTFAAGRLGPDCLPRLHGTWLAAAALDPLALPPGCVLKPSRGPGLRRLWPGEDPRAEAAAWLATLPVRPTPRLLAEEWIAAPPWHCLVAGGRAVPLDDAAPEPALLAAALALGEGLGPVRLRLHWRDGQVLFGAIRHD